MPVTAFVTRCLCFRLHTEGLRSPTSKFFKSPHNFWPCFLLKRQLLNEKIWCLETKLWSKVIFSQRVQDMQKHLFDLSTYVTDCHCSGEINLNKFFLTTKLPFVQSSPILMGATLNNFDCVCLTEAHVQWTGCFCIQKREAVVVWVVCNIN